MENDLVTLTYAWWKSKRPASWTVAEHLKNPTVNTRGKEEYDLAMEVARLIEAEGRKW